MSAYRFCRSDDVPLLVRACNACYRVHFPDRSEMTVDEFKRAARELNVWASSCMVAFEGKEPVGVLIVAKRETESWIYCIGVHPDHQRREHASHMLDSLSRKLAILGPPVLLAEVPETWAGPRAFLEACGYRPRRRLVDYVADTEPASSSAAEVIVPVTLAELVEAEAFDREARRCWSRAPRTLLNLQKEHHGIALAAGDRFGATLLYSESHDRPWREILALEARDPARGEAMLELLVRHYRGADERPLRIRRVAEEEIDPQRLADWGFRAAGVTIEYAALAGPT